jgi:ribosomal protein L17
MKKSAERGALAPLDVAQRYTIAEAQSYLRIAHASIYKEINAGRIRVLKHGKRTFVPGSEIARLSRVEGTEEAPREAASAVKSAISETTSYRLLNRRNHLALMKDIARQQALWDAIEKFRPGGASRKVSNSPRSSARKSEGRCCRRASNTRRDDQDDRARSPFFPPARGPTRVPMVTAKRTPRMSEKGRIQKYRPGRRLAANTGH